MSNERLSGIVSNQKPSLIGISPSIQLRSSNSTSNLSNSHLSLPQTPLNQSNQSINQSRTLTKSINYHQTPKESGIDNIFNNKLRMNEESWNMMERMEGLLRGRVGEWEKPLFLKTLVLMETTELSNIKNSMLSLFQGWLLAQLQLNNQNHSNNSHDSSSKIIVRSISSSVPITSNRSSSTSISTSSSTSNSEISWVSSSFHLCLGLVNGISQLNDPIERSLIFGTQSMIIVCSTLGFQLFNHNNSKIAFWEKERQRMSRFLLPNLFRKVPLSSFILFNSSDSDGGFDMNNFEENYIEIWKEIASSIKLEFIDVSSERVSSSESIISSIRGGLERNCLRSLLVPNLSMGNLWDVIVRRVQNVLKPLVSVDSALFSFDSSPQQLSIGSSQILDLWNSLVDKICDEVASRELCLVEWPVPEFQSIQQSTTNSFQHIPNDWNSIARLSQLRNELISTLRLRPLPSLPDISIRFQIFENIVQFCKQNKLLDGDGDQFFLGQLKSMIKEDKAISTASAATTTVTPTESEQSKYGWLNVFDLIFQRTLSKFRSKLSKSGAIVCFSERSSLYDKIQHNISEIVASGKKRKRLRDLGKLQREISDELNHSKSFDYQLENVVKNNSGGSSSSAGTMMVLDKHTNNNNNNGNGNIGNTNGMARNSMQSEIERLRHEEREFEKRLDSLISESPIVKKQRTKNSFSQY